MRVLVLGSGGKLGTLLRRAWPADANLSGSWHTRDQFDILSDHNKLAAACASHDCILVLAGVTKELGEQRFIDNARLARAVLKAAEGKRVLLTSTAAVYGSQSGLLDERAEIKPISQYGISKAEMETEAAAFPNATCLRIGNVAGADALLGQSRREYVVHQFSDDQFVSRSYIGPGNLVKVLKMLCTSKHDLPPILNVAIEGAVSMTALLNCAGLNWTAEPAPELAIPKVELDVTLLQNLLEPRLIRGSVETIIGDWRATTGTSI